jgi:acetyltransferase-like isoleucine patch superfamily enzyme
MDSDGKDTRDAPKPTGWRKLFGVVRDEVVGVHPRLMALNLAVGVLPRHQASEARARLFALAGFRIGEGTRIQAPPRINGQAKLFSNLVVGKNCDIAAECVFDLAEKITIGDKVTLSPGVMILTSTHELDIKEHRAGPLQLAPVTVGDGVLLGARSIILPGVTIGDGAVVNPGAVVNKDVAPQTRVGGTPAVPIEVLKAHEVPTS